MEMQSQSSQNRIKAIFPFYWWVVLIGLLIWNLLAIRSGQMAEKDIPYSTFLEQVKANQVSQVTITGSEITGKAFNVDPSILPSSEQNNGQVPATGDNQPASIGTFRTQYPDIVGDPNLIDLLTNHHVQFNAQPAYALWARLLLTRALPIALLIGVIILMALKIQRSPVGIFGLKRSKSRVFTGEHPQTTFEDVSIDAEVKSDLQAVVDFLSDPVRFQEIGARAPRRLLLVGQPGTGKTLMAQATAGEAGVPLFSIDLARVMEFGPSRIRDLFLQARTFTPSIIFLDRLDAAGLQQGQVNQKDEQEQIRSQLLAEIDALDKQPKVILLAATNRLDSIDPELLHHGRFDRRVSVELPDLPGRERILRIHTRQLNLAKNVNLGRLARTTTGFNGAELSNLCNEAALTAARKNKERVDMSDFEEAFDQILINSPRKLLLNEHERRVAAYHVAGHALLTWYSPQVDLPRKVTIIPNEPASLTGELLPGDDQISYSKDYLLSRMAVLLGGRAAEEVVIGQVTTGGENDLYEATRLARRMVTRWGMGRLGPVALEPRNEPPQSGPTGNQEWNYSEETAARIDQDIQDLLKTRSAAVKKILSESRSQLDQLVEALLQQETVTQSEMVHILGPRPYESADHPNQPVEVTELHQKTNIL